MQILGEVVLLPELQHLDVIPKISKDLRPVRGKDNEDLKQGSSQTLLYPLLKDLRHGRIQFFSRAPFATFQVASQSVNHARRVRFFFTPCSSTSGSASAQRVAEPQTSLFQRSSSILFTIKKTSMPAVSQMLLEHSARRRGSASRRMRGMHIIGPCWVWIEARSTSSLLSLAELRMYAQVEHHSEKSSAGVRPTIGKPATQCTKPQRMSESHKDAATFQRKFAFEQGAAE